MLNMSYINSKIVHCLLEQHIQLIQFDGFVDPNLCFCHEHIFSHVGIVIRKHLSWNCFRCTIRSIATRLNAQFRCQPTELCENIFNHHIDVLCTRIWCQLAEIVVVKALAQRIELCVLTQVMFAAPMAQFRAQMPIVAQHHVLQRIPVWCNKFTALTCQRPISKWEIRQFVFVVMESLEIVEKQQLFQEFWLTENVCIQTLHFQQVINDAHQFQCNRIFTSR